MSTRIPKEVLERVRKVGTLPRGQSLRAVQEIQQRISKLRGKIRASALNALGRLIQDEKDDEESTTLFVASLILLRNPRGVSLKTLNQSLITLGWVFRNSPAKANSKSGLGESDDDEADDDEGALLPGGKKKTSANEPVQWSRFIPQDSLLSRDIAAVVPPARPCNVIYALIGVIYSNFDPVETRTALVLLNAMNAKLLRDFGWLVRRISAGVLPPVEKKKRKKEEETKREGPTSAPKWRGLRQLLQREAGSHKGRLKLLFNQLRGTPRSWLAFWAAANGPCSNTKLLIAELYGSGPLRDRLLAIQSLRRLWRLRLKGASAKRKAIYLVPTLRALSGITNPPLLQLKARRALDALPQLDKLPEKVQRRAQLRGIPSAAELARNFSLPSIKDDGNKPLH